MERKHPRNALLCALDRATYDALAPHLARVEFQRGDLFYEPGQPMDHVYFPHSGVISLLSVMEDGSAIETSTVGRESAVGLASAAKLGVPLDRVNVDGGAIALGHPIGMSGARIALHLAKELGRRGGGIGAVGLCGGGGQGDALIVKVPRV